VASAAAILWPILHSLAPTIRLGRQQWESYESANAAFAERVLKASRPTDLIWVQDFHLMLLPGMVRRRRSRARIGWFCHIPWPGHDFFEILPWRRAILDGLLGADLLGFHTEGYADNFLGCVDALVPDARVDFARKSVRLSDHTVRVTVSPIGIPLDEIQTLASDPEVTAEVERIQRWVDNRRIILGVDRLDYTKGIPHRIHAFEQLLRSDRAARNRYVLVQIMVPSRTDVRAYADLKTEIDRLVGDINGRFSSAGRVPIQYFYRNLPATQLYAHYRAADVALVTPLRDGMNLVALEFAACRIHGGGVLVLSEFAGAAQYLNDALIVNPYDIQGLSHTLREALAMPAEEAARRMHGLRAQVHKLDVHRWADDYLDQLEKN
jgi:trehalose 6-phosphate synthase/phosphatase